MWCHDPLPQDDLAGTPSAMVIMFGGKFDVKKPILSHHFFGGVSYFWLALLPADHYFRSAYSMFTLQVAELSLLAITTVRY